MKLDESVTRWKAALSSAATGPLLIAREVVALGEDWERHKDDANGLSYTAWLAKNLGRGMGLPFFSERADAMARIATVLGPSTGTSVVQRQLHHEVVVWIARNVPKERWRVSVSAIIEYKAKHNGGNVLSKKQSTLVVQKLIGRTDKRKKVACLGCERREQRIKELESMLRLGSVGE